MFGGGQLSSTSDSRSFYIMDRIERYLGNTGQVVAPVCTCEMAVALGKYIYNRPSLLNAIEGSRESEEVKWPVIYGINIFEEKEIQC